MQHRYYSAQTNERKALRQQIIEAEANIFRVATGDRLEYWQGEQRELERQIKKLGKISRPQEKKRGEVAAKIAELKQFADEVERGDRALSFFSYHLHFRDVFEKRGGFDIVVGNPPYVRQEKLSEQLKQALQIEFPLVFNGRADIYTYFYYRVTTLLHQKGILTFISSNKWFRANYGKSLRKHISEIYCIHSIIDFGELPVFDGLFWI